MRRLGVVATARASFYVYNSESEIDALAQALLEARRYFGHATTATR
jgi:cysteine desulfurase/selenocysteine lyase